MEGTVTVYGDYDQCLDIQDEREGLKGKYCMLKFAVDKANVDLESSLVGQELSRVVPPARFYDPWLAMCMPSGCDQSDVYAIADQSTQQSYLKLLNVTHCDTRESITFNYDKLIPEQKFSLFFVGFIVALVYIGTFSEAVLGKRFLRSFSVVTNSRELVYVDPKVQRLAAADLLKTVFSLLAATLHATCATVSSLGPYVVCEFSFDTRRLLLLIAQVASLIPRSNQGHGERRAKVLDAAFHKHARPLHCGLYCRTGGRLGCLAFGQEGNL